METTNYILSVVNDNPAVVIIKLSSSVFLSVIKEQIPSNITIQEWQEDWCEGYDVDNSTVIRFRP